MKIRKQTRNPDELKNMKHSNKVVLIMAVYQNRNMEVGRWIEKRNSPNKLNIYMKKKMIKIILRHKIKSER